MNLSIITATWQRHELLRRLIGQVEAQHAQAGLQLEHIIVSDGPDEGARAVADGHSLVRYYELPTHTGGYGGPCRDLGILRATGEYVCFWDDDNEFFPFAAPTLYAAAYGHDIGIVQIIHRQLNRLVPREWRGYIRKNDIDTGCVCVRAELARRASWGPGYGADYEWCAALAGLGAQLQFVPIVIGIHT